MEKILGFKFPVHRHLGFHDVTALSYCFKQKNLSFLTIETTQWCHEIQDGGVQEILKAKIFSVYYYYVTSHLSSKICNLGIIWGNLASTHANSLGSLL